MCACVAWVLVSRFPCGGFKVLVWSCSVPPEPPFPEPPFPDRPSRDRPSRDRSSRDRPSPGPPKISPFFPLPPQNSSRPGRRGSHTTARELQTCTFERPGASNTKIPREDPQRGEKRTNFAAGQGKKKREILALRAPTLRTPTLRGPTLRGPTLRGPTLRGPTLRGPTFSGLGPPPFGAPTLRGPTLLGPTLLGPTLLGPHPLGPHFF